MFRLAILLENNKTLGQNFKTADEAETWLLSISEKEKVKRADLLDLETKERKRVF